MKHHKSRERIRTHAEVFTPEWIINLQFRHIVDQDPDVLQIHSTVLDPCVGTGNYLLHILERKADWYIMGSRPCKDNLDDAMLALACNTFAVDIQADNVAETKQRLLDFFKKRVSTDRKLNDIKAVLDDHIIVGDYLELGGKWPYRPPHLVITNPPYQQMDGGYGASSKPIYNLFVDTARESGAMLVSMLIPARWYAGGKGLDKFRKSMLSDRRICLLNDFPVASKVFPTVRLNGGVCYFIWDKRYNGPCECIENPDNYMKK